MVDGAVGGLLLTLGVSTVPVIAVWLCLHGREIADRALRLGRRTHLVGRPPPRTFARTIEQLAADLRRLAPQARHPAPGTTMATHRGVVAAYDALLADACARLDVEHALDALPPGIEREAERLRLHAALREAGLEIS